LAANQYKATRAVAEGKAYPLSEISSLTIGLSFGNNAFDLVSFWLGDRNAVFSPAEKRVFSPKYLPDMSSQNTSDLQRTRCPFTSDCE
jgi:hypothetical protein